MDAAIALLLIVVLGSLALGLLVGLLLRQLRQRLRRQIEQRWAPSDRLKLSLTANLFGVRSHGYRQIRGIGGLVLTPQDLYFLRAAPRKEFVVPLAAIRRIDHPQQFLGKSILYPLLRVTYEQDGQVDEIAWAVQHPQAWKAAIARAIETLPQDHS
jgi:hypothetical protein